NEKKRPDNVDDTPRRFVMNDTVGHERADTIDGEITQTQVLKTLAKQTENESSERRPFVTRHQFPNPVIPIFLVAVTFLAGGKPGGVCLIKSFHAAPMEKCPGIKKHDGGNCDANDHCKIDITPCLSRSLPIGHAVKRV